MKSKTYIVTYRKHSGRILKEERLADTHFDAAAAVRQSHHLKASDIISNVIKDTGKVWGIGRRTFENDR
jgi:hypothetical protein